MNSSNKTRLSVICALSVITVLLLGGIFINQSISNYINSTTVSAPVFLPSLQPERCYGSTGDDTFIDAFFIGDDTYVFYNSENGATVQKDGENGFIKSYDCTVLFVTLTKNGFAAVTKEGENLSLKTIDTNGIPHSLFAITQNQAQVEYLGYDGDICLAIRHKGDFDYVLSYYKFDENLSTVYHRDIYSLYNLSAVACYPLSNKTVIFFSATYGSVKRGGYTVLHNSSLAMETRYFSGLVDYTVTDAKPYKDGFIITAISNGTISAITLDQNFNETLTALSDKAYLDAKIYTNGSSCYVGLMSENSVDMKCIDDGSTISGFASRVYDCIFCDGVAVFASLKDGVTYVNHIGTGISSPVISTAPKSVILKKRSGLTLFATLNSSAHSFSSKGGTDVYYATLL